MFRITLPSGHSIEFPHVVGDDKSSSLARAGGNGPTPEPVGAAKWYDGDTFEYYLAGQDTPILKIPMNLPRSTPPH
jgi:endonuclease YncB( thermonuclease family)